jgi:hypothetical protein
LEAKCKERAAQEKGKRNIVNKKTQHTAPAKTISPKKKKEREKSF